MNKITLLFALLISILTFSQVNFEKAYFVDNSGKRIECLIKNADWRSNPTAFDYKINESSAIETASIKDVESFEIINKVKYLRSTVKIDKSPNNLNNLSIEEAPVFMEEELFLKQIVSGTANLYKYQNGNLVRFFYHKDEGSIEQLVYKMYRSESTNYRYNTAYKQQLQKNFNCGNSDGEIDRIEYKENTLTDFFVNYNNCADPSSAQKVIEANKGIFNLNIRPRVNFSSLKLMNDPQKLSADMGSKATFGFGLELEYVLPFNKNKWALIVEPTYQYYKAENTLDTPSVSGGKIITTADFKSIELPFGIRHYMYIDQKSKLFINVQYVLDFGMDSSIKSLRSDSSLYLDIDNRVKTFPRYAAGVGYNYNAKFGIELRQLFGKTKYGFWTASYNTTALILSYKIL